MRRLLDRVGWCALWHNERAEARGGRLRRGGEGSGFRRLRSCRRGQLGQLGVDDLFETAQGFGTRDELVVDDDGRSGVDTGAIGLGAVGFDRGEVFLLLETGAEGRDVELEGRGVFHEVSGLEGAVRFEELVTVLPVFV